MLKCLILSSSLLALSFFQLIIEQFVILIQTCSTSCVPCSFFSSLLFSCTSVTGIFFQKEKPRAIFSTVEMDGRRPKNVDSSELFVQNDSDPLVNQVN